MENENSLFAIYNHSRKLVIRESNCNIMAMKYPVNVEVENPEELISTLDNLIQNILVGIDSSHSNNMQQITDKSSGTNKRGIDLGLSRGFSGSQAAKHLMGMSAASFANGPGRKR
ncbi:hypothetical protein HUG17_5488 [Dermatophagoides farinae]|uniref:Uncharacterized protein n=1 Tax=Dermatophagoides farinae TaxID=6954 RepID=A0A9D4SI64_DERFA|nr:hypothetical protein HUG17_5488 [Dermatophagoides farinae]